MGINILLIDQRAHLKSKGHTITFGIKESDDGASILNGYITNGIKPLFSLIENKIAYGVLDMQEIDMDICLKVLDKYLYVLNNYSNISVFEKESIINSVNELIGDNTNFFYK